MARQLNEKQRAFAEAYAKTGVATTAALSAGYEGKSIHQIAHRLVKTPSVAAEIARLRSKLEKKSEISAARVLEELGKLAFGNMQDLFDPETGELLPMNKLPRDVAATLTAFENDKGFQKVKTASKLSALETLSKIMGMVKQHEATQASVTIVLSPPREVRAPVDQSQLRPEW